MSAEKGKRVIPHRSRLRTLAPERRTLPQLLEMQAAVYGEKPLVRAGDRVRSFLQMRDAASETAEVLAQAGIERGDRVAILSSNRLELLDFILGCAWLGAIAVPMNVAWRGSQLAHGLTNSAPRLLVIESELAPLLETIDRSPSLERVWILGEPVDRVPQGIPTERAPSLTGARSVRAAADLGPDATVAILYTSGTTGASKGVCCPQAQFYWWGIVVGEMLELTDEDVLYTCLPLFHTNAINAFVQAVVAGATYAFGERFSASRFWQSVREVDATVTYLLGAMVSILWARPASPGDADHRVRIALAPATPANLQEPFKERFGVRLLDGYGSTETNACIGGTANGQRPGLMGVVLDDFEADVVDEHDVSVPDGTAGELVLRSRQPFSFATGYFELPEATVSAWRNLWFHTGDRVVRSEDGWFRFIDRLKDAIRRRGENISSQEVEQVLLEHPAVASAAVFAVPSDLGEDEVMAAIVTRPGANLEPIEVINHCQPRLAYFAIPRYLDFVDELPLTENGKVRKVVLRARGVTQMTWDREAAGVVLARSPTTSR